MADVLVQDDVIEITSGLYDSEDGIKLKVAGDDFPRVHLTPQGEVKTGDGTGAPTSLAGFQVESWTPVLYMDSGEVDAGEDGDVWGEWQQVGGWGFAQGRFTLGEDFDVPAGSLLFIQIPFPVPQDHLYDCGHALVAGSPIDPGVVVDGHVTGGDLSGAFSLAPGTIPANFVVVDCSSSNVEGTWEASPGSWSSVNPVTPDEGTFWRFSISCPIDLSAL